MVDQEGLIRFSNQKVLFDPSDRCRWITGLTEILLNPGSEKRRLII